MSGPGDESAGTTMRAARVGDDRTLSLAEISRPEPGPGEIRVRITACGICGSDLHAQHRKSWHPGLVPGHEIAGIVEAVGPGSQTAAAERGLDLGTPCVVEPLESCGRCSPCATGRVPLCPDLRIAGVHQQGGFAEFIRAPIERVFAQPGRNQDAALLTLIEPLAVALHALDRACLAPGERVLVIGGGPVGLLCAFAAQEAGAGEVVIRTRYPSQADLARRLGVHRVSSTDHTIEEAGLADRFPVVLETVGGASETLLEAGRAAAPGGRIAILGLFARSPALDPMELLQKELSLLWSNCYHATHREGADFERAAELLRTHEAILGAIITARLPLEEVEEAFELAGQKSAGSGKVVVLVSPE